MHPHYESYIKLQAFGQNFTPYTFCENKTVTPQASQSQAPDSDHRSGRSASFRQFLEKCNLWLEITFSPVEFACCSQFYVNLLFVIRFCVLN